MACLIVNYVEINYHQTEQVGETTFGVGQCALNATDINMRITFVVNACNKYKYNRLRR